MDPDLTPERLLDTLAARVPGMVAVEAWGETSLFYNPGRVLPRGVYFATVKQKDGANDRASRLDRAGVFRFNLGTSKPLFRARFGPPPPRPGKGGVVEGPWDFTGLDVITPHPVYGWMSWVSVLNPSHRTFAEMEEMIEAAVQKAEAAFDKKVG
jgi:hypothetical protein